MTFLFACLGVAALAYALSAIVAHVVMTSPVERALPGVVQAGVGLLVSFAYFAAAWQVLAPPQAMWLGIALLATCVLPGRWRLLLSPPELRRFARTHARAFAACFALLIVFFAPLLIARQFGPFTEGGGDVTIYADGAQYLASRGLTARGMAASSLREVAANAADVIGAGADRADLRQAAAQRLRSADPASIDPPAAENASYRAITMRTMSAFILAPYAQFAFLAGQDNYAVYYGLQALVYALVVACGWAALRPLGGLPAGFYAALLTTSHALIAVAYNTYSAQLIAVLACAVILAVVMNGLRPWSRAGLRTCAIALVFIFVTYAYYLSILVPLLALAWVVPRAEAVAQPRPPGEDRGAWVAGAIVLAMLAALAYAGSGESLRLVRELTSGGLSGGSNVYMGDPIAAFSLRWMAFAFGFVSQQHLPPFAAEAPGVGTAIGWGVGAAAAAGMLGLAMLANAVVAGSAARETARRAFLAWGIIALTVAMHLSVGQAYLYTQAKASQNVIALVYAVLVLPLALTPAPRTKWVLVALLGVLIACLAVPRFEFTSRLARGLDRAAILDQSYFDAARRIRAADPKAFVLFEPRKSADLYLGIQPFAGMSLLPTRHLVLDRLELRGDQIARVRVAPAQLLPAMDGDARVWRLAFDARQARWQAQRLADRPGIHALFLADDYEPAFARRPRGRDAADEGVFAYVRNGDVVLAIPRDTPCTVEVRLEARDGSKSASLARSVAATGAHGGAVGADGDVTVVRHAIAAAPHPRLVRLAGFEGEYWANVRVNGVEIE